MNASGQSIRNTRRAGWLAVSALVAASMAGCNNAGQGAASGATLGALAGMGLGSLTGDMGKGAAAGAIVGGIGGLILGDQNNRRSGNNKYPD